MLRWKRFNLKSFKDLLFTLTSWIHLELIYKHDSWHRSDFMFPIYRANVPTSFAVCSSFSFMIYTSPLMCSKSISCGLGSVLSVLLPLSIYWFISKVLIPHLSELLSCEWLYYCFSLSLPLVEDCFPAIFMADLDLIPLRKH